MTKYFLALNKVFDQKKLLGDEIFYHIFFTFVLSSLNTV